MIKIEKEIINAHMEQLLAGKLDTSLEVIHLTEENPELAKYLTSLMNSDLLRQISLPAAVSIPGGMLLMYQIIKHQIEVEELRE
tara:strand:+ start:238 stop:489 length:252 start_codon:yes stop_codon:yes gene_type:complete